MAINQGIFIDELIKAKDTKWTNKGYLKRKPPVEAHGTPFPFLFFFFFFFGTFASLLSSYLKPDHELKQKLSSLSYFFLKPLRETNLLPLIPWSLNTRTGPVH